MAVPAIGKLGVWSLEMRFGDPAASNAVAAELEDMGYGAIWIPGGIDAGAPADVERLLAATSQITIATGILNVWKHEPDELAAWFLGLSPEYQARTLLGLGISHAPIIGDQWRKPVTIMSTFLDAVFEEGLLRDHTVLAALGPKMLAKSAEYTAGAHPYLVTPEHTAEARQILGEKALLAPEQGVILESDPDKAREMAIAALTNYARLPNYRNSWLRLGFTDAEIDGFAPHFLEAIFAMGSVEQVVERVNAHWQAGADHVCLQVIAGPQGGPFEVLLPQWHALAKALV